MDVPDSCTERTAFVEQVYPKLREYCRHRYGLEFQVCVCVCVCVDAHERVLASRAGAFCAYSVSVEIVELSIKQFTQQFTLTVYTHSVLTLSCATHTPPHVLYCIDMNILLDKMLN